MSSAPAFAATPHVGVAAVSTANTARDGTGTIATVFTAGSNGSRIERIWLKATADPADSTIVFFLHDGTTAWALTEVDLGNPAAASNTVASYEQWIDIGPISIPSGWSLRASITVALTAGVVNVFAFGADF